MGCLTIYSFTVFSGDIKKSSENDQLTGHFQSFFIYFFFRPPPPTLNLKKKSRKSTYKKILALLILFHKQAEVYVVSITIDDAYEGCSNMNASSFITFVSYMLRQNGMRFFKGLDVTFKLAPDLKKNRVYL